MTTVEVVLQAARERVPGATPRIISDNGPQFMAKDFKEFIRLCTMTHVRTSPFYPQSNGKLERLTKSLKGECIRPNSPVSLSDARGLVAPTSNTTTPCVCIAPSAMSPPRPSSKAARGRSLPSASAVWPRHGQRA